MQAVKANDTTNNAAGYTVKAVTDRFMALDVDAQGNGEKAAWKRYLSLSLLAMAKGWDLKKVAELVFGKGVKPSKTFQNMASLAKNCRHPMLGNRDWADIKVMSIDAAQAEVLAMINSHMAVLSCTSKNEYEKFCTFTVAEAEDKRKQETIDKAEAQAQAKAEAEPDPVAEAEAQAKADAAPERTPAEAAIGALAEAGRDDLMTVLAHVVSRMSADDMVMVRDQLDAILANAAQPVAAIRAA